MRTIFLHCWIALLLIGCTTAPTSSTSTNPFLPTLSPTNTSMHPTVTPTSTVTPIPSTIPSSTKPIPSVLPTPILQISSPLQGISVEELPDILTQPFIEPRPGQDDGHYGVDYAYYRRGNQESILGTPVLAVLSGRVASLLMDRPPFGYAVIIETSLEDLPKDWIKALNLPTVPDPLPVIDRVTCDLTDTAKLLALPGESIYTIYAHLNVTPTVQAGEMVKAGAQIGEVGNTGYSGNPHLHLETHVGPSKVSFESIAFYEIATTKQERHNYCLWRLSGIFRVFDPRVLFAKQE